MSHNLVLRGYRKKLEADVFRESVEQSQDALYIADADGEVVFVNEGFLKMTGYEFRDVHGKTPDSWMHRMEGQEDYTKVLSRIRIRKEPFSGKRWHRREDGTTYEATVHISPVVDEFGEVAWFIAREHDLTESRERTLFLQQILDNMPIGICLVEAHSTKIVLSNQYADTLLSRAGFKKIEEFRKVYDKLCLIDSKKSYPASKIPLMETLNTKEEARKDDIEIACAKCANETTSMIWKMHTMPLFDAQGTLKHVLVALDDVTHQKQLEHKMTDAISVASHQLRTPLTGIKWAVDELRKGEEFGASKEDKIAIFDTLYDATVRMFNVVQGLLDVSKLEQGKIEIKLESISLEKLVAEVIEELQPRISEKKLNVKQSKLHSIPEAEFDVLLVSAGLITVSGLAMGIDSAVAKETISADGQTVAVLGHGFATIYPKTNARLADEIVENGGLLLTEFPAQVRPGKFTFPARNRIIAGLSLGTVVAEAAAQSGSLITASLALEYGKEVFAVPGNIFDTNMDGTHHLIQKSGAKLITNAEDVLSELGIVAPEKKESHYRAQTPAEQIILDQLSSMPQSIDELVDKSDLQIAEVNATLTLMELKRGAKNIGSGKWVRA